MPDVVCSPGWDDRPRAVTVVVATHRRAAYLRELLDALAAQEGAPAYDVVLADDGSADDTWATLSGLVRASAGPVLAIRLPANVGAGRARNRATAHGTGALLAVTDDDCLPERGWLRHLVAPFANERVVLVQGRTVPQDVSPPGPWARTLWVTDPTPFLETCNVAYRRSAFDAVGGFDEIDPVFARSGKGFGEDTWLAARLLAHGERAFAADAVVRHRWRTGTFGDHLRERRLIRDFPLLTRRVPEVAAALWGGVFLSRRTASVDLAAVGTVAAVISRRPLLLAATLPWLAGTLGPARARRGPLALRLAQAATADVVGLAALVEGSLRHRRLVL